MNVTAAPPEREWINVATGDRIHPYSMHKIANLAYVEVTNKETDQNGSLKRWVLIRDGEYETWVEAAAQDVYGYPRRPGEEVSQAEREAIELKCRAIRTDRTVGADPDVSIGDALAPLIEELATDEPNHAVARHLLIATYYAAKQNPGLEEGIVGELRELVHESTGHVDTSHPGSLQGALERALDSE